jgi:tRNA A-37 threonylcarbamoyl transferase component Bud32
MVEDTITICGDIVIKTGPPQLMRIEVEKTCRAHRISEQCGLFRAPKVLDYDETSGTAKFECIHNIKTLREVTASGRPPESFMEKLGQSLAIIHKDLKLPENMVIPLSKDYSLTGSEVFLHGDLGPCNVCVNANNFEIVILDWRTARKLGEKVTYGSRYFDIMWFVYNLFYRPLGRARYKAAVEAGPMAEEFLRGYFKTSDYAYNHQELVNYMKRFLRVRKRGFHFKRQLLLVPSHIKLRRFIASFHP